MDKKYRKGFFGFASVLLLFILSLSIVSAYVIDVPIEQLNPKTSWSWSVLTNLSQTLNADVAGLPITQVSFTIKKEAPVSLNFEKLPSKPVSLAMPNSSNVYAYIKVEHNIAADNLESAAVMFRVNNSWLENNSVNAEDIALFRLNGGWSEYPAVLSNSDDVFTYYKTYIDEFRYLAIGQKPGTALAPVVAPATAAETPIAETAKPAAEPEEAEAETVDTEADDSAIDAKTTASENSGSKFIWWLITGVLLFIIAAAYFFYQQKVGNEERESAGKNQGAILRSAGEVSRERGGERHEKSKGKK